MCLVVYGEVPSLRRVRHDAHDAVDGQLVLIGKHQFTQLGDDIAQLAFKRTALSSRQFHCKI